MFQFVENNKDKIKGFIACYDRIRLKGHLQRFSYAEGMMHHLYQSDTKVFDYPNYAKKIAKRYKNHVEKLASKSGVAIEYVNSYQASKEKIVEDVLNKRGRHSGLVHIISAVESAHVYQPSYDKDQGKAYLKSRWGKCLHYYFYIMDEQLGLCYFRVSTWCPFGIQFYCNGHSYLYQQLDKKGVPYKAIDNALIDTENFKRVQRLSDKFTPELIMKRLKRYQEKFCPMIKWFNEPAYWTIDQAEYATDIVFKSQEALNPIYDNLTKQALHLVKPENVYSFLGKKLTANYQGELGNDFKARIYGSRIKHYCRDASVKMYDKYGCVLRVETTVNNISFFTIKRPVEKRDGTQEEKIAPMKKTLYSRALFQTVQNTRCKDFAHTRG